MTTTYTATCDRCGKTPLEPNDHHDGTITLSSPENRRRYLPDGVDGHDVDLCGTCYRELERGLRAWFRGATITVHRTLPDRIVRPHPHSELRP